MKRELLIMLILSLTTFLFISCRNQPKPRTIHWAGTLNVSEPGDSIIGRTFYLAYYLELSDTGEVKMMTRKMFQGPKEYYKITLSPSIKNTILNLSMNDSMYIKSNDTVPCICESFFYCLRLQYDTMDNSTGLLRPIRNRIQQRIINMMDSIWKNPNIKLETFFDLSQYEKNTEKDLFTRGILVKDTMHYEKVIDMTEKK